METNPRAVAFSGSLDPWFSRLFADDEPTAPGSGWPGGVVAVLAALLGLGGVLCLRFPGTLTAPSLRAIYPLGLVRVLLGALLALAFLLGAASMFLRRRKVLGATAVALGGAALAAGGPWVALPAIVGPGAGIGLDWFLLNALIMTAVFVPLERVAPRNRTQRVFRRGWSTDAIYTFVGHASIQVVSAVVVIPGQLLRDRVFGAANLGRLPLWAQLPLALFVADLAFYWIHRAAHRFPFFWRLHRLHHSSDRMDWLASERLHLAEIVVVRALVLAPLTLLGFTQTAILVYVTFASFHAVFIHANFGPALGWLEPWLMTPRLHHLHHAVDPDAIDKNFAVHLPILDRLFGTLFAPKGRWPARTGVVGFRAPDGYWGQQASVFVREPEARGWLGRSRRDDRARASRALVGLFCVVIALSVVGCATVPKADRDLFAAIQKDNATEVERLVASGANVNVTHDPDYDGQSPLGWASGWASPRTVEFLIARGAIVNAANKHGTTPLHVAAYHEEPSVTALLIRKGAAVNARTDLGWTPLHKAMERLASAPATRTLPEAEVAKVASIVELLLASGARVDVQGAIGGMPLHMAALTGQRALVQMLIDKGAAVDARSRDGMTPLYQAARKDATEVAQLLIARGADVNARTKSGNTALMIAADQGSAEVAKLLLARRADVNARDQEGFPPLLWACRSLLIRYTLEASTSGAKDLQHKLPAGATAGACEAVGEVKGNFGAVAMLLVNGGADPNVAAPAFTPLGAAATIGDGALAEALMAHGAAIDDTSTGEAPLHAAISEGHADVAKLIIDRGANVNARNRSQLTPLHFLATYMHDRTLAELLIRHGADVNAKDQGGHTPMEVAVRAGNDEVADVLRRHGAK